VTLPPLLAQPLNRSPERSVERFVIHQLHSLVEAAGPFGPAAFVAAYAVLTVALVPGTIPSLAAGALFGPVWGSLLVVAGATAGAVGAFEVARRIGHQRTRRLVGERVLRADAWVQRRGVSGVIGLRLLPVVPFNALNYAFGLPNYLANSYFPAELFREADLVPVGTRAATGSYETKTKVEENRPTKSYLLAGDERSIGKIAQLLEAPASGGAARAAQERLRQFDVVRMPTLDEVLRSRPDFSDEELLTWEAVLHPAVDAHGEAPPPSASSSWASGPTGCSYSGARSP